jgi:hypothetical protein
VWKEVAVASIEMSVSAGGCKKGEVKSKLGNNSAFVAQRTLMIKKKTL